ncbi:MAG: helix-turn-helix transcriptional regulator [Nitratireductor sp.]
MTPFGEKMRAMRRDKGVTQKEMAQALGVSPAYLSALERGRRGVPSWTFLQKVLGYFNIIWDDAEELRRIAEQSRPRVVIDTSGLSPAATRLANLLATDIARLGEDDIAALIDRIRAVGRRSKRFD